MHVRHVTLHSNVQTRLDRAETIVTGTFVIVNSGGTNADIVRGRYRVFWSEFGLPIDLDLEEQGSSFTFATTEDGPIRGGESRTYQFSAGTPLGASAKDVASGACQLFVVGFARYADDAEIERFMGFCRRYSLADGTRGDRFIAIKDPDYEYED